MKIRKTNEELIRAAFRIPVRLKKAIEDKAVAERRSVNDQAIVLFENALKHEEESK